MARYAAFGLSHRPTYFKEGLDQVTDRPILFSAPMVRALLDGRKTQTRRLLKPKKHACLISEDWTDDYILDPGNREWLESYYRWRVSDRLWVKETHRVATWLEDGEVCVSYNADSVRSGWLSPPDEQFVERLCAKLDKAGVQTGESGDYEDIPPGLLQRVSIHMPRWASRLTLTVTDVRVERLQAISEADAIAEGSQEPTLVATIGACWSERDAYAKLWDAINGASAWGKNPWVVAVSFRVARHNIDQPALLTNEKETGT